MRIDETCPDCGAERPSWLGSSHVKTCAKHGRRNEDGTYIVHKHCCDGLAPEEYWRAWTPPFSNRANWVTNP